MADMSPQQPVNVSPQQHVNAVPQQTAWQQPANAASGQAWQQPVNGTPMQAWQGTAPNPVPGGQTYMQPPYNYPPQQYPYGKRPDTKQTENLKKNFRTLSLASFFYACFYAFCMYRNGSGITYPFFLAGSLWFYCFCMKKLEISLKKDSVFYIISLLLLGISTFTTADARIIFMNKAGVWALTISFLLHQFYRDTEWTFGRYFCYCITAVFGSLGEIARPFQDLALYRKNRGKKTKGNALYIFIGLCFSIPLFFVVWLLLMSADVIFMDMTERFFEMLDLGNLIGIFFTVVIMFFVAYWIMAYLCKKTFSEAPWKRMQAESILAITVALPVTILYLVFSGVQIVCLFMGYIGLENLTYAEYARQGFFQLLVVCVLNLILVLVGRAYFKENKFLNGILTVMSLCTYIMILSSALRMLLYIKQYYLTFLRIFVLWFLLVLFVLFTGVIISIYWKKFPLFKYSMVVVTICYLVLSFSPPDYWIAKCNVANMGSSVSSFFDSRGYTDYLYLSQLSADAAPALAEVLAEEGFDPELVTQGVTGSDRYDLYGGGRHSDESWGYYYMEKIYLSYERMGVRSFNLSKYNAWKILQKY